MAFPGDRQWKLRCSIESSSIYGDPVDDLWVCITHAQLPQNAITAGHDEAMQEGGVDVAASLDEEGTTQIPCWVQRAELDATPANSRVEIWIRRQDVSDSVNTHLWLWWGSTTETAPAVGANYGRNDVFGDATGDGSPPAAWAVFGFDEDPSGPSPQFTDLTGGGRDAELWSYYNTDDPPPGSRTESAPGRAVVLEQRSGRSDGIRISGETWDPGTGAMSMIVVAGSDNTDQWSFWNFGSGSDSLSWYPTSYTYAAETTAASVNAAAQTAAQHVWAFTRSGTSAGLYVDDSYTSSTDADWATSDWTATDLFLYYGSGDLTLSFLALFDCELNQYWMRAFYECVLNPGDFWDVGSITAAAITAYLVFSPLLAGSEVRVYEQPHPTIWSCDLDGFAPDDLADAYVTFETLESGAPTTRYLWWRLDGSGTDPTPGGTGTRVDIVTGDSAEDMAEATATALDALTYASCSDDGTAFTVANIENGTATEPTVGDWAGATTIVQAGGSSSDEIDGIETSTGTSYSAEYTVVRPRLATIVVLRLGSEPIRIESYPLSVSGAVVPVQQRTDRAFTD